jgi:uncharacterized membrane protein
VAGRANYASGACTNHAITLSKADRGVRIQAGHEDRRNAVTTSLSIGLLAALSVFNGFTYLSGNPQAVQDFIHLGYPQQLRIILGIAKLLGAIALVVPGSAELKEWAYAGFTFAWISAFVAHYLAKDGPIAFIPLILLLLLAVSYTTRQATRRWREKVMTA